MAEVKIAELSYEELKLYEKQLTEELTKVRFQLYQYKKAKLHADLTDKTVKKA